MKIGYVTEYDATNVQSWSGIGYNIHHQLSLAGADVALMGGLETKRTIRSRLSHRLWNKLGYNYLSDRDPNVLRGYARQLEDRLLKCPCDIILSPGTIPIAYLNTSIPIVYWTDATFASLIGYYHSFSRVAPPSICHGHKAERLALAKAALAIYSSAWAAESAVRDYGADPQKVTVLPFGANMGKLPTRDEVARCIDARSMTECRLLFVGVDWERKGGRKAVETARQLKSFGLKVRLDMVGQMVSDIPDFATSHGFLKKDDPEQMAGLEQLFRSAHFLILPTKADCVPVVLAEANAFGVPVLVHDTGGISSTVSNGENGFLFSPDCLPRTIAEEILRQWAHPDNYKALCWKSYCHVQSLQNWGRNVQSLLRQLERVLG